MTKTMCKRVARLLRMSIIVVCLVVPAVAQPTGPKEEEEVLLPEHLVAVVEDVWSPGKCGNSLQSFYSRYRYHRHDCGVEITSPEDYLTQAMDMYRDTMEHPEKYKKVKRVSPETGEKLYKYINPDAQTFIIHNRDKKIRAYGGLYRYCGLHAASRRARLLAQQEKQEG